SIRSLRLGVLHWMLLIERFSPRSLLTLNIGLHFQVESTNDKGKMFWISSADASRLPTNGKGPRTEVLSPLVKVVQLRLGNTGSGRTALHGILLCGCNDPCGDQRVAKLSHASHKLAVVLGSGSNVRYQIGDRAATREQSVRYTRIAPANHNRRSKIGIRFAIEIVSRT